MARRVPPAKGKPAAADPSFTGFVVRLLAYLFLASLTVSLGSLHQRLGPVQRLMAATVTVAANGLGAQAQVSDTTIRVPQAALDINHECTGIFVVLVYAMFILAYPAPWRNRVSGIAFGLFMLTLVNVGRLILLTVIASARPAWFAYFHEYFFQGLFIALLAFLASIWTEQVRRATIQQIPA